MAPADEEGVIGAEQLLMSDDKIVDSQNSNLAISAQIWDSGSYILYSVIKSRMNF